MKNLVPSVFSLRPPDTIHVTSVPRTSLFFTALLNYIILDANQRTKSGEGLGTRLGNEARERG